MKLMRQARIAAAMLAPAVPLGSAAASTIYEGSQSVGELSATYSITTNGSIGSITQHDIEAFTFAIGNQLDSVSFDSSNAIALGDFYASSTGLSFGRLLQFESITRSGTTATAQLVFFNRFSSPLIFASLATAKTSDSFSSFVSNPVFAVVQTAPPVRPVPEPATWAMMLVGFGMVGASMRYRRKHTEVSFA